MLHPSSIFNHDSVSYWNVWVCFFAAAWCVLSGLWFGLLHREAWVMSTTVHLGEGPGRGNDLPLLLIYQHNLLLLSEDWNKCCSWRGGAERAGAGMRFTPNTDTDFTRKPDEGQIHWPFWFGVRHGGFLTDQIVWTQRWDNTTRCIFELNAVTVQDCRKRQKKM